MEFTGGAWIGRNGGSFDKFSFKSAALCDRCNLSFNPAASSATILFSKGSWKEKPSELEVGSGLWVPMSDKKVEFRQICDQL